MDRQISIYDFLGEQELSQMTEAEMVKVVGDRLGMDFTEKRYESGKYISTEYQAKYKGIILTLSLSTYSFSDQPIILYGYDNKKEKSGGGGPAESITEAVEALKRIINRYERR